MKIPTFLLLMGLFLSVSTILMAQQNSTEWVGKTYQVNGHWSIDTVDSQQYFLLGDDFSTNPGPDVKVYLTTLPIDQIGPRDAVDQTEGVVFLGPLQAAKGAQRYPIPAEVDLADFKSIVLHCKAYSVVWGGIRLE